MYPVTQPNGITSHSPMSLPNGAAPPRPLTTAARARIARDVHAVSANILRRLVSLREHAAAERARIDAAALPILRRHDARNEETGEQIDLIADLYLAPDATAAAIFADIDAAGLTDEEGRCPALLAASAVRRAEAGLFREAARIDPAYADAARLLSPQRRARVLAKLESMASVPLID